MKCQILFFRKNIINLSSAESAHSVVSVEVEKSALSVATVLSYILL